jgi:threonine synthase
MRHGVLARYSKYLPITSFTPMITMGEGDTPLVLSRRLGSSMGCEQLFFKVEGCNPTGSFKDRGMVVAIAKALEDRSSAIICASTGNTSASAAAYGAHCGIRTIVVVPWGDVAKGKLVQAIACGARILSIDGSFDQALALVRQVSEGRSITLVNSVNPYRLEGQKTAAFEIMDVLGDAPDYLFIPVGNAGNITAYWTGFKEYHNLGKASIRPMMMGFQAEGAAPIVLGHPIDYPKTIASAIRIGNPASWQGAIMARDQSGGSIDTVTDQDILQAYQELALKEGIFCEPASAASLAGLMKLVRNGLDLTDKRVVCVITGTGLKDPDLVASLSPEGEQEKVPATPREIGKALRALGV